MQNWLLPLFLIKLLTLIGIFLSLLYLRPRRLGKEGNEPELDKSYNLLAEFSLVALLSVGLFIFIIVFSVTR